MKNEKVTHYEITGSDGKVYKSYTEANAVFVAKIYRAVKITQITELYLK